MAAPPADLVDLTSPSDEESPAEQRQAKKGKPKRGSDDDCEIVSAAPASRSSGRQSTQREGGPSNSNADEDVVFAGGDVGQVRLPVQGKQ